jgi:beta-xylosidase
MPLVYAGNFPDPFVLRVPGKGFYAYGTNGKLGNVQLLHAYDLRVWREVGDALPSLPDWATPGRTWAPEVLPLPAGRWAMYYTARCTASNRQAIGVALADSLEGPFIGAAGGPLVDQDEGGSIDASAFVDADGKMYLLWKNDGNAIGVDTWIYLQQVNPDDPARLIGEAVRLIKQDQPWEGELVEGPCLWLRDGRYYLFYAANAFAKPEYGEGYAVADSITGPYTKAPENPILVSRSDAVGPGHASMFEHDGRTWLAYHAWWPDDIGGPTGRQFWIDELTWIDDRPVVRV